MDTQHGDTLQDRVEELELAVAELRRTVHHIDQALVERSLDFTQPEQPQSPIVQPALTDASTRPAQEQALGTPTEPLRTEEPTRRFRFDTLRSGEYWLNKIGRGL